MNKTDATTIDEYLAEFPESVQQKVVQIRNIIHEIVPGATEAIKYDMPTFVYKENMLSVGVFKKHIGVYPFAAGSTAFNEAISPYRSGKASLNFSLKDPLPVDLITELVHNRVKQIEISASLRR